MIGIVRQAAGSNARDLYIPMARAQALAEPGGQVDIVYVPAASAASVGAMTGGPSWLLPSARATNPAKPGRRDGRMAADHRAAGPQPRRASDLWPLVQCAWLKPENSPHAAQLTPPCHSHPALFLRRFPSSERFSERPQSDAARAPNGGSGAEQTGTWVAERGGIALAATCPAR
jgi:hypothetical protein